MAFTRIQIISRALTLIGKAPINSVGTDTLANAASDAFDLLLEANLSTGSWRFATDVVQLSQLDETPIGLTWNYIYSLPGDFQKLIRLYPLTWDFEIYKDGRLYTNLNNDLYLEYVMTIDPNALPAYFVKFFCLELAAWLSPGNSQNPQLTSYLEGKAETGRAIAMAADAQNRPQTPIISAPIINARFVSVVVDSQ